MFQNIRRQFYSKLNEGREIRVIRNLMPKNRKRFGGVFVKHKNSAGRLTGN